MNIQFNNTCFVDEGWNCSSQICFSELFDSESVGYYVGCLGKQNVEKKCVRKGLLFDVYEDGGKSSLYGIFRSNLTFYEQILTAPHGSVTSYYEDAHGCIAARLEEVEVEKELYARYTSNIQDKILQDFLCLCAWEADLKVPELARYVLLSQLSAKKKRCYIRNFYATHEYVNITGKREDSTDIHNVDSVNGHKFKIIRQMIFKPIESFRYYAKLPVLSCNNQFLSFIFPMIQSLILLWYGMIIRVVSDKET